MLMLPALSRGSGQDTRTWASSSRDRTGLVIASPVLSDYQNEASLYHTLYRLDFFSALLFKLIQ